MPEITADTSLSSASILNGLGAPGEFQAIYTLYVQDQDGKIIPPARFGGVQTTISFRLPPQQIQFARVTRQEIIKDLAGAYAIVHGGEGLGSITMAGTHGVGQFRTDENGGTVASFGKVTRDLFVDFFSAWVRSNDFLSRAGLPMNQMVLSISGGSWSEQALEEYFIWPRNFPRDMRSAAKPHSWEWSLDLILLAPKSFGGQDDPLGLPSASKLTLDLDTLDADLDQLTGWAAVARRGTSLLQNLKDYRSQLASLRDKIQGSIQDVQGAVYEWTDIARGSFQIGTEIAKAFNMASLVDPVRDAIMGTVYEGQRLCGTAVVLQRQWVRTSSITQSLSGSLGAIPPRAPSVTLSPGDTLASIASRELGDSTRWPELVAVNGLEWPFVDFSGPGGAPDPDFAGKAILGASSVLKLPLPASNLGLGIADDPFGSDLAENPERPGQLIMGQENLAGAVRRRFQTPVGRIPWHKDYGSLLPTYLGGPYDTNTVMASRGEALRCLKADPRVLSVKRLDIVLSTGQIGFESTVETPTGVIPITGAVT
jgi:phage baseplate assembly protein W